MAEERTIEQLSFEFDEFKAYALPVIDNHQPLQQTSTLMWLSPAPLVEPFQPK